MTEPGRCLPGGEEVNNHQCIPSICELIHQFLQGKQSAVHAIIAKKSAQPPARVLPALCYRAQGNVEGSGAVKTSKLNMGRIHMWQCLGLVVYS